MGRSLSQDYPYIGYVNVPPAVTDLEYNQSTGQLTLTNSNESQLTTIIDVPPAEILLPTGTWSPSGVLSTASAVRTVDCAVYDVAGGQQLQPGIPLVHLGFFCLASSASGVALAGSDIIWAKMVVPNRGAGNNIEDVGIFFLNQTSEPLDFPIAYLGIQPSNDSYGGYVGLTADGFVSKCIDDGRMVSTVTTTFENPLSPGDIVYVGLDRSNSTLVVQHGTYPTVYNGAQLIFSAFPEGESLFTSAFVKFDSEVGSLTDGHIEFSLGTSDGGKTPIRCMGETQPPVGAEDGREYVVAYSGVYGSYELRKGDVVRFYNDLSDLVITRLPNITEDDIPPGVVSVSFNSETSELTLTRLFKDSTLDTISTEIQVPASGGFAGISDIEPQDGQFNVGDKEFSDAGNILVHCTTSTLDVRVYVIATPGPSSLTPQVYVNDVLVTNMAPSESRSVWEGYRDLTIAGTGVISVRHAEGGTGSVPITYQPAPSITSATFLGAYPIANQVQYAAGATVQVHIVAGSSFTRVEFQNASDTATTAHDTGTIAATTSYTYAATIADRGTVTQNLPARVRVQDSLGAWSDWYDTDTAGTTDHIHTVALNNTLPQASFSITYPVSQYAIQGADSATLNLTSSDCDFVEFTSQGDQVSFSSPSSATNQTVTLSAGGVGIYNITSPNVQLVARREANNAYNTFTTTVWIADVDPVVTMTTASSRLRSGGTNGSSPQDHTITLSSTQRLQTGVSVDASIGTWQGSWATANSGITWTRSLRIDDTDPKGSGSFSNMSVTNLAGRVVTTVSSGGTYTVGGFVQRVITVAAWPNREADIGAYVTNTGKLRVTNLSKGSSGSLNTTFGTSVSNLVDSYTITGPTGVYNSGGRLLYNRDLANATSNTSGIQQFEVEEIV